MNKFKAASLLLALAFAATPATRADDPPAEPRKTPKISDLLSDAVIIRGKDFEIKRSKFDEEIIRVRAGYSGRGREIAPDEMPKLERQLMDTMIFNAILFHRANDEQKAAGKAEAAKRFETMRTNAPTAEAFAMQLKAIGYTIEKLHNRLEEETIAQAVLRSKINVTESAMKKYYDENPDRFEEPMRMKIGHILMLTIDPRTNTPFNDEKRQQQREKIEAVLKRALAGEDFATLAKTYSEDPTSKERGGEDTVLRGGMAPEMDAALATMKTNQVSDVIATRFGYHIVKLLEKTPGSKIPMEKINNELRAFLEEAELKKLMPKLYEDAKKEAGVEIIAEDLQELEKMPLDPTETSNGRKRPETLK